MIELKPVTLEGRIKTLDHNARYFTLTLRTGQVSGKIFWNANHESYMRKQKAGYYENFPAMPDNDGTYQVIDIRYAKAPDDFPKSGGKAPATNNAYILLQVCFKEACETAREMIVMTDQALDEPEYNRIMNIATTRAIADAKALMQAAKEMNE